MVFTAVIEKDEDGYFAYIPELEGCVSQGDTYEEALRNIKEALELYLEVLPNKEKQALSRKKVISVTPIEIVVA